MEIFEVNSNEGKMSIMQKCGMDVLSSSKNLNLHRKEKFLAFANNDLLNGFVYIDKSGNITDMHTLDFAVSLGLDAQMKQYVADNYKN